MYMTPGIRLLAVLLLAVIAFFVLGVFMPELAAVIVAILVGVVALYALPEKRPTRRPGA